LCCQVDIRALYKLLQKWYAAVVISCCRIKSNWVFSTFKTWVKFLVRNLLNTDIITEKLLPLLRKNVKIFRVKRACRYKDFFRVCYKSGGWRL
jgi:hypothetical protein